jgi:arylesterase / paraoxonase
MLTFAHRGFFISNDHYYRKGLARTLEDKYGPFRWASSVVYCADENDKGFDCHVVSPKNSHAYANGILLIDQGRSMVVNDIVDGSVTFYDVHPETKLLTYRRTIVC